MQPTFSVRWLTLVAALVIALYLCWRLIQPFLDVLLWAMVLVVVFQPVHRRLSARLGRPSWAATCSTLLVIVTILLPVTLVTLAVVQELRLLAGTLETNPIQLLNFDSPILGPLLRRINQYVDLERFQSEEFLRTHLEAWTSARTDGALGVGCSQV